MRIHTDTLTAANLHAAASAARVDFDRFEMRGSRSRDHAFDFTLQGESRRHQNGGNGKAATWDQWGVFISTLFDLDAGMTIPRAYEDREDFDYKTFDRFDGSDFPVDAHGDHRFQYSGIPYQQNCAKCSASMRWQ